MPNKVHNETPALRTLLIQRDILNSKYGLTRKFLAKKYNTNISTIKRALNTLETAGFILEKDNRHRYKFKIEDEYKQLKDLLHFSIEDQVLLHEAIDNIAPDTTRAKILKKKLSSLYDYKKLGYSYLRRPHLIKIDTLHKAITDKKQTVLINYQSSNSNEISDRNIEPFHLNTTDDILYAFDIDKKELRNFKISRITKVKISDSNWQFENFHNLLQTDPFRIVSNKNILVHLKITLGGKNELEEKFPLTKAFIMESEEDGIYDFQCRVNNKFIGLDNFILGYHREIVEIISPDELMLHLKRQISDIGNLL